TFRMRLSLHSFPTRRSSDLDKITISFETSTTLENLPDGSNWVAFVDGPIVLAAKTSTEDLDGLFADDSRMGHATHGKYIPLDQRSEEHTSELQSRENLVCRL